MSLAQVLPFVKDSPHAKARFKACLGCEYKHRHLFANWCGTPIVGNATTHNGKSIELCGCNVKYKSKVNEESCPAGKWEN